MSFLVYKRELGGGSAVLTPTGDMFSLAGGHLIYRAWEKLGKPLNQGWHVTADELIRLHNDQESYRTRRLIIDFHPTSTSRIAIVELLDIYAYVCGSEEDPWVPLMLKLRDVLYFDEAPVNPKEKERKISKLCEPTNDDYIIEFLYLTGKKWGWGKNGVTNAVFLTKETRDFFRAFF